ncbi:Teichoic acid translocation permease protein TagG [Bacillus sp. THAF10]|uniref:ABC transporter permease n=1 Tax=Bacillus sp. THAF10 TaxID=2587848 RepID=UPI0012687650|nr:ABC transporter permease [Bacillus sp. THAF10]QFT90688.1 Teichoic acid translocation permease protein TagG [Bacillus sp. THAF10]
MRSLMKVLKEHSDNLYLINRLSLYEMKSLNNNTFLGFWWEVLNPLILISIYWFVFGFGIFSNRGNIELYGTEIDFLPWMLSGIVVWFFISPAILQSSKSIYSKIKIISKMSFPMSVIPTYVIMSKIYQHIVLLLIIIVMLIYLDFPINIHYLQLPYFIFCTVILLMAIGFITSTLTTLLRDIQMVIQAIVRVLIYMTPFLWPPYHMKPEIIVTIMKLNPLFYLAEGYRASLLGLAWYPVEHWQYTIYFWVVTITLLMMGSFLHLKFRKRFVDFL